MDINKAIAGIFGLIAIYLIFAGKDTKGNLSKLVGSGGNTAIDLIGTLQGRGGGSGIASGGVRTASFEPAFDSSGRMGVYPAILS